MLRRTLTPAVCTSIQNQETWQGSKGTACVAAVLSNAAVGGRIDACVNHEVDCVVSEVKETQLGDTAISVAPTFKEPPRDAFTFVFQREDRQTFGEDKTGRLVMRHVRHGRCVEHLTILAWVREWQCMVTTLCWGRGDSES